ncbi:retrovirus-related pol polyprotein from transposon TNT 1-94 [Tanacetum coccineum]
MIETIHVDFNELTAMASEQSSLEPALHEMTLATPSSGLVSNLPPSAPFVPPSRHEWYLVFQQVFYEFFFPLASVASPVPAVKAPAPVESTGTPSSTTVDQDASSPIEPKTYKYALTKSCWIKAMQEELNEFERLKVCELVPRLDKVMVITLKWIYKVKLDELGGILKNNARLVAHGYRQEEGIDNPNHVYRLKKALYGLKHALRAWYDLLSSFLLSQGFSKGTVDPTLFIIREGKDILLVQINVDDIIFASTTTELYSAIALVAFADADHTGCQDTRLSTSGRMRSFTPETLKELPDEAEE